MNALTALAARRGAPLLALLAAATARAQDQDAASAAIDLRPLARSGERYELSETTRWSDELSTLRLRAGEEVLIDVGGASAEALGGALGFRRTLRVERGFEDAVEAIDERDGAARATRLARTWKQMKAELRVDERGAERGRRAKRWSSPLVGRTANLSRGEGDLVSASLRPRQAPPGQEAPADPPAADLALGVLDVRFERCLPPQPVALGATWALDASAARALLGGADGYPFPRAEGYPGGLAEEARQADPLAIFLGRAACRGEARLEAADDGTATIAFELTVALDRVEVYRSQSDAAPAEAGAPKDGDAASTSEDSAARPGSAAEGASTSALPWSGELKARGHLVFDRARRQVQSCKVNATFELRLEARGAEGPSQAQRELATKGELERSVRLFAVSS
jgi:hypothetical protein